MRRPVRYPAIEHNFIDTKDGEIRSAENPFINRKAYENVPEHKRTYLLHDMDLKDTPIRMAIYGDHEKDFNTYVIIGKILKAKIEENKNI